MRQPDWDKARCTDGTLNLHTAFQDAISGEPTLPFPEEASKYITEVDHLQPISSRQVAAVVLVEAERRGKAGAQ